MVVRFSAKNTLVAQKHCAISRHEKMALYSLRRVALRLPSPSPRVCMGGQVGVRQRQNQNFLDR